MQIEQIDVLNISTPPTSATSDVPVVETKPDSQAAPEAGTSPDASATSSETTDTPTDDATDAGADDAADTDPSKPKKPAKGVQKALDRLAKEREEQRERAVGAEQRLERALAALESLKPAPVEVVEPTRSKFESDDEYAEARADWLADKKFEAKQREAQQAEVARQIEQSRQEVQKNWQGRLEVARAELPDFDTVAARDDVPVSLPMAHAILLSEHGPKIQYYLGQNPAEAERIAKLGPIDAVREIGRLEATISQKKLAPLSKAPAPINPVGGREAVAGKDPSEMTMDEYAAANAHKYRRKP